MVYGATIEYVGSFNHAVLKKGRIMLKKRYGQSFLMQYKYMIALVGCLAGMIFLLGALCTYNPYDSSLFFYSNTNAPITNMFGMLGSNMAALLFYLCGGAAYLVLGLLFYCFWILITKKKLRTVIDSFIAWAVLIVSVSALSYAYHVDIVAQASPGGLLGYASFNLFARWFDGMAPAFSFMLVMVSLIVICQFALAHLLRAMVWCLHLITDRKRFWMPLYHAGCVAFRAVGSGVKAALGYFRRVLGGAMIHEQEEFIFDQDDQDTPADPAWDLAVHVPSLDESINKPEAVAAAPKQVTQPIAPMPAPIAASAVSHKETPPLMPEAAAMQTPYALPNIDIFIGVAHEQDDRTLMQELEKRARILEEKLERFSVQGKVTAIKRGPVVTVFEYQPDIDSKISKIIALEDDLSLALQAMSIRIIAPIPGRSVVGFEVANTKRKNVSFAKVIKSHAYQNFSGTLPLLLGEDTIGNDVVVDLARMPHLLIAGSTGSGKSVALNGMLTSMLCWHRPDELRLVLIDPKRLEFAPFADIPHLLFPIITDSRKVAPVLRYVVKEMEERYERMAKAGARNIFDYHAMMGEKYSMPFLVIVIDELADLMMTAGREIEDLITRIAQMARAAGIHMMVATQRPSVDVITGLIKVNFPSRISFRVTSKIDSRTILDCGGADKLLGRGDMLFLDSSSASLKRIHGAYVSDGEIANLVQHLRAQQKPNYIELPPEHLEQDGQLDQADDQLYKEVLDFLQTIDEISISLLQRRFRIGYNRSARIIDMLESHGLILPSQGGKTRKVVR